MGLVYTLYMSREAQADLSIIKKSYPQSIRNRIEKLLKELEISPRMGIGNPEQLKHYISREVWSRRVDKKNRIVYEILEQEARIIILKLLMHYSDK